MLAGDIKETQLVELVDAMVLLEEGTLVGAEAEVILDAAHGFEELVV